MANEGISTLPLSSILMSFLVSVMIVNCVASDPVPAVVGIATIGGISTSITSPM